MQNFSLSRRQLVATAGSVALLGLPRHDLMAQSAYSSVLHPLDFAGKSVANLVSNYDLQNAAHIVMYDPFWLSNSSNQVGQDVRYADQYDRTRGMNEINQWIASKTLVAGVPHVNIQDYAGGINSPNTEYYRGKTSGPISRATGVIVDNNGAVGGFINGYDTPSDKPDNKPWNDPGWKEFGPNIHFVKKLYSPQVFSENGMHLHCGVLANIGQTFFAPAAVEAGTYGAGGQLGWRATFVRADGQPLKPGLDARGNPFFELAVVLGLWDSRNAEAPDNANGDFVGGFTAGESWVAGTIVAGKTSRFVTNFGANSFTGPQPWRQAQFYFGITRQNMINILDGFGAGAYTTPEMVRINGTGFNAELFDNRPDGQRGEFKPGQFGFSFSNTIIDIF